MSAGHSTIQLQRGTPVTVNRKEVLLTKITPHILISVDGGKASRCRPDDTLKVGNKTFKTHLTEDCRVELTPIVELPAVVEKALKAMKPTRPALELSLQN